MRNAADCDTDLRFPSPARAAGRHLNISPARRKTAHAVSAPKKADTILALNATLPKGMKVNALTKSA